jgi:hypothetical protein
VAAHWPIRTNATENSVRAPVSNRGAALTRHSACQLPLERLDIPCPVEPKPPREVPVDPLRGADVFVEVEPLRLPDSAVETEVGVRLDEYDE